MREILTGSEGLSGILAMSQFIGPRLKLKRAQKHISAIADILKAFLATQPFKLSVVPDGIELQISQELPAEIPLLIGDAIHNMRTALDLLACDLVRLNGKSAHKVYFPFASSATELDDQIKKKRFNRAGADAVALLKTKRPYTGGDVLLRGIHDLDILDKHQLIVPVFNTAMVRELKIDTGEGGCTTLVDCHFIGSRFTIGLPPNSNPIPGDKIEAVPAFAEGTPRPFAGSKVGESLEQAAELVLGIIEAFEALRFSKKSNAGPSAGVIAKN